MTGLGTYTSLLRCLGPDWVVGRLAYEAQRRLGVLERRTPTAPWSAPEAPGRLGRFLFEPEDLAGYRPRLAAWDAEGGGPGAVERADEAVGGRFRYFDHATADLGPDPDWHANPFTGERLAADAHWSRLGDFGAGDIKVIWEPSRFGFVYALVRAWARTGDERYPRAFWRLVESWRTRNPPNQGPHWKCGQEVAFRMMAWAFGLYGFGASPESTAERVAALAQMIAASARRIAANTGYALAQKNNHGISEGAGLWTAGLVLPDLAEAGAWREHGRAILEGQARELIYVDGSFAQHSVNYHRVMLHDYLWAVALGDRNGQPLSRALRDRVGCAAHWLYQLMDAGTGRAPCCGQNDGALVLPLASAAPEDFRPAAQAAHYLTTGERCWGPGPWDEELLWLFGPAALAAPQATPTRGDWSAEEGGYHTLRSPSGFAFVRCGAFRHRPSQADALHLDLWWRGQNVALDPGTYSYNAPAPWDNPLARSVWHNTVTVDGRDQMDRAGRFLWVPWLRGRTLARGVSADGAVAWWQGEHDGYERLKAPARHRRCVVRLGNDAWLVLDTVTSRGPHVYRLHWLSPDLPHAWDPGAGRLWLETGAGPYQVLVGTLGVPSEASLVRADPDGPRGWRAPHYGERAPALSLTCQVRARAATFWTVFAPPPAEVALVGRGLEIRAAVWSCGVQLASGDGPRRVTVRYEAAGRTETVEI